jgi:hypothetical protein
MAAGGGRCGSDFAGAGRPTGQFFATDPSTVRPGRLSVGFDSILFSRLACADGSHGPRRGFFTD